MGANLYGAKALWFGGWGGTNLFDAVLPESISAVDTSKAISDARKSRAAFISSRWERACSAAC